MTLNFVLISNVLIKPYTIHTVIISLGLILGSSVVAWGSHKIFYKNKEIEKKSFYSNAHHPIYLFLAAHSILLLFIIIPLLKKYPLLSPEINKFFFNIHTYISTYYYFFALYLFIFALLAFSLYQLYYFSEFSFRQKCSTLVLATFTFITLFMATKYITPAVAQTISKTNIGVIFNILFGPSLGLINISIIFPIRKLLPKYY